MNPATYFLRIEGVNLDSFVYDTRDLSTIRGASLILLDAVQTAESFLKGNVDPDVITLSQGASTGLFQLECDDIQSTTEELSAHLKKKYPNATFAVNGLLNLKGRDFRSNLENLIALNRLNQLQSASLAIPKENQTSVSKVCSVDGKTPAADETLRKAPISDRTHRRREYGRRKKQKFYKAFADNFADSLPSFAEDFETIAREVTPPKILDGKIAVFYADGNSFGKIQQEHCNSPETLKAWDTFIRDKRSKFLNKFLKEEIIAKSGDWQIDTKKDSKARFETLLWGGDELMFVMPAKLGWRFATQFFEAFNGLVFKDKTLSHAGALVFCQHHAPIDRIKRLAQGQIAEFVKNDRSRDGLGVVVLESFDHLGNDYQSAMNLRYSHALPLQEMIFRPRCDTPLHVVLSTFAVGIAELRDSSSGFGRGQLRKLVTHLLAEARTIKRDERLSTAAIHHQIAALADSDEIRPNYFPSVTASILNDLAELFPSKCALWLQLEELLDYAKP